MKEMAEDEGGLVSGLGLEKYQSSNGATLATDASETALNNKLSALVNRHKVMLFMKGIPSSPRCGFSRQIVEILDSYNVSYDAFNILEDEEVRQGLKVYSDWPTYPQLYCGGELVGGLDIVQEMQESGDLKILLEG
jgi:Grx4 family monothiol glutaredoxin